MESMLPASRPTERNVKYGWDSMTRRQYAPSQVKVLGLNVTWPSVARLSWLWSFALARRFPTHVSMRRDVWSRTCEDRSSAFFRRFE